jgi:hypothetical protein
MIQALSRVKFLLTSVLSLEGGEEDGVAISLRSRQSQEARSERPKFAPVFLFATYYTYTRGFLTFTLFRLGRGELEAVPLGTRLPRSSGSERVVGLESRNDSLNSFYPVKILVKAIDFPNHSFLHEASIKGIHKGQPSPGIKLQR